MRVLKLALACLALGGCATIVEGTTQNIRVEVVPDTGTCVLTRKGETIGASMPGQRMVSVSKAMDDIRFQCSAPGYENKEDELVSKISPATVASILLLDFGIVDAISGAATKYPDRLTVVLQPLHKPLEPVPAMPPKRPR
jgi:hypothetical protein